MKCLYKTQAPAPRYRNHMTHADILPTLLAFGIAAATPGPATVSVSTTAMAAGTRPAATLGLGLALGLACWGLIAAAGLGELLMQSAVALTALRWFGGIYLLVLACQSGRSALAATPTGSVSAAHSSRRLFTQGLLLNLSNPKAVMAWISVLALGMEPGGDKATLWTNTAWCASLGLLIYLVYAMAFSQEAVRNCYKHWRRWIEGLAAVLFAYFGMKLLFTRGPSWWNEEQA